MCLNRPAVGEVRLRGFDSGAHLLGRVVGGQGQGVAGHDDDDDKVFVEVTHCGGLHGAGLPDL